MKQSLLDVENKISRRTMLASAAAMAASPALAEGCRVGPAPHEKGPTVWMDLDQVELDAAYDQTFYAPLMFDILKRLDTNSEEVRGRLGRPERRAYGPTEIEKLDIYRAKRPNSPVFVFLHGGAWLRGTAKEQGFAAELFVNAGAHYVVLDFIAIGQAGGDLRVMADQVRRGIAWIYKNAASFGGDPNRVYAGGHSSGAHLCGVALLTDWPRDYGLPQDFVKGALLMSGMYDMKPVRLSKRSSYVKFDDDMEQSMSSQRHLDRLQTPVVVTFGTNETPEFQRQSRDFAAQVKSAGKPAELIEAANYNHFETLETLSNPYGPNGRAALALMKLSST
jgi:arylformamidase